MHVAILGGSRVTGPWRPGKSEWGLVLLGGLELDFRQAQLTEEMTRVSLVCILGGATVTVPPGMPVTVTGFSIFGGRGVKRLAAPGPPAPGQKGLHVFSIVAFGGVWVEEKGTV